MGGKFKHRLGPLAQKFDAQPFAISISDLTSPDHPLVFFNSAFTDLTGFGEEMLGQNCRFLQDDFENDAARAEIRKTLAVEGSCHVILHNRRKNGTQFYNLLMLDVVGGPSQAGLLAIGSQFDLGDKDPMRALEGAIFEPFKGSEARVQLPVKLELERRRVVADAAREMLVAWCDGQEI